MKVSNCCGVPNRNIGEDGPDYEDLSICPDCKDHCIYIEEGEDEENSLPYEEVKAKLEKGLAIPVKDREFSPEQKKIIYDPEILDERKN